MSEIMHTYIEIHECRTIIIQTLNITEISEIEIH
jgi:hypothetical protein